METRKQKLIRYLVSAAYTFFSVAALALTSDILGIIDAGGTLDKTFLIATLTGATVAGFRAVVVLCGEWLKKQPNPVKLAGRLFKK